MNIFIVNNSAIPPSFGGLVRHYYFSKYLSKLGHNVRILTSSQIHNTNINMAENKNFITEKVIDGVEYTFVRTLRYTINNWRRVVSMLQFSVNVVLAIKRLIKNGDKPDIIYMSSPSPFCCYTVLKYAKKHKIPCVQEIRDLWPLSITAYNNISESNPIIKVLYKLEKWLYVNADKLIFTMPGGKDYIVEKGWDTEVSLSKISHINNGVDLEEFSYNLTNYQSNDLELKEEGEFKITFTGSIRHVYQLDTILEVAEICQKMLPEVHIYIYGDGPEKNRLVKLAEKLNLNNISFKGKVEKKLIASILSNSNITLLHFKEVGLGKYGASSNKFFEYCAASKPVLSTVNIKHSLIEKYDCGIETKSQKPEIIAEAIKRFYDMSDEELAEKGKQAYKIALDHDYFYLTKKLLNVLQEVYEKKIK